MSDEAVPRHDMRRKRQALDRASCEHILEQGTSGVLALVDADGFPYAVPLSYAHERGFLYFHSACSGHKLDAIAHCDRASFCVIGKDEIVPEKFTTYFRSVIAFGRIRIVDDEPLRRHALELLGRKYSPGLEKAMEREIEGSLARTCILELEVGRLTGKQAIELVGSP